MFKRLKEKWNIKSNVQLVLIFVIFSVTGSASLVVRKFIFGWLGITSDTSLWIKVPL
jgi:ferrochelatase